MQKIVGRMVGALIRLLGLSILATAVVAAVVAIRHMLDTPQQMENELPGEARIYRWRQEHVYYQLLGTADAPPLLLLHTPEIGASAYEMRSIMELLAPYYRIYAPDLLGFGLSDHPRLDYSPETYIALCRDFLTDVVKQPATIVASRVSCNFAVTLATTSPALCERLVLISPVALFGDDQKSPLMTSLIDTPAVKLLLYSILSTWPALQYIRQRQHAVSDAAALNHVHAAAHQLGAEHAPMAVLAGKLAYNVAEQFEKMQQPALIIWGASQLHNSQHIAGPQGASRHVQVELLQNAGLAVHEERPDEVVATILRWRKQGQQQQAISNGASTPALDQAGVSELVEMRDATPNKQADQFVEVQVAAPSTQQESQTLQEAAPLEAANLQETPASQESERVEATEQPQTGDLVSQDQEPEQRSEDTDDDQVQPNDPTVEAFCVKCKQKRIVQDAHEVTMKNGRTAIRGKCTVCGTGLYRIGRLASD